MPATNDTDSPGKNLLGIAYMGSAMLAGVVVSVLIKLLAAEAMVLVVLALRFVSGLPILAGAAWIARRRAMFAINKKTRVAGRIIIGHVNIVLWVLALAHTTLGQATALFQSSAIFVTILAPIILGERVGIYRGSAVVAGIFGIYLITNPLAGGFNIGTAYGLASSLTGAALVIYLRVLGRTEEPVSLALWHNLVGALLYPALLLPVAGIGALGEAAAARPGIVLLLALVGSVMQITITTAYRHGEAVVMMPVRYLSVPLAVAAGWFFWQEALRPAEALGMAIVVSACIVISVREYVLSKSR